MRRILAPLLVVIFILLMASVSYAASSGWEVEKKQLVYYIDRYSKPAQTASGTMTIDGIQYEFTDKGVLKGNGTVQKIIKYEKYIDYYYIDDDNNIAVGWQTINGKKYYFRDSSYSYGEAYTDGMYIIDSETYYFDETGVMQTGFVKIEDATYYFDSDGKRAIGWKEIEGKKYYFSEERYKKGEMCIGRTYIDNDCYYFDESGVMQTGLVHEYYPKDVIYGYGEDGKQLSGWQNLNGNTYYFKPEAAMGSEYIGKDYYYFDNNGVMQTGFIIEKRKTVLGEQEKKYYYQNDGKRYTGWLNLDGYTYYMSPEMVYGYQSIENDIYYFDDEGHMLTGLYTVNNNIYFFGEDGKAIKGWKTVDGKTYYFRPAAYVATKVQIDGIYYLFEMDGTLHSHTIEIDYGFPATSEEPGLTDGKHCSVCGEVIEEQKLIRPLDVYAPIALYLDISGTFTFLEAGPYYVSYSCSVPAVIIKAFVYSDIQFTSQAELIESRRTISSLLNYSMQVATYTNVELVIRYSNSSSIYKKPVYSVDFLNGNELVTLEFHDIGVSQQSNNLIVNLIKSISIKSKRNNPLSIDTKKRVTGFVARCYQLILGRGADSEGLGGWVTALASGKSTASQIIDGFVRSAEFTNRNLSNGEKVDILYKTMLNREADAVGRASWLEAMAQGYTLQHIINGFCGSVEFVNLCNEYGIHPGSVDAGPIQPVVPAADMENIQKFVKRCYEIILGRGVDPTGLNDWSNLLATGQAQASQIIDGIVNSQEFQLRGLTNEQKVDCLYQAMLGRGADPDGRAAWVQALVDGYPYAAIINGFCGSTEFINICNDYGIQPGSVQVKGTMVKRVSIDPENADPSAPVVRVGYNSEFINEEKARAFVKHCYESVLGREGDAEGVEAYTALILNGEKTPKRVAYEFVFSPEFQGRLPGNEAFIRILYRLYLNREPNAEELGGWVAMLEGGTSLEEIVKGFADGAEFRALVREMKE